MQVLVTWECASYEPALLAVEQALVCASQDALSETRALGRQLFGAFAASWPHRIHDLLTHMQPSLQAKIIDAINAYSSGQTCSMTNSMIPTFWRPKRRLLS